MNIKSISFFAVLLLFGQLNAQNSKDTSTNSYGWGTKLLGNYHARIEAPYIIYNKDKYYWKGLKYLLQPTKINLFKAHKLVNQLNELREEKAFNESFDLYIDNKKLDGFMDFFHKGHCHRDCNECNYCNKFAEKAISYLVPVEQHDKAMESLRQTKSMMIKGDLF